MQMVRNATDMPTEIWRVLKWAEQDTFIAMCTQGRRLDGNKGNILTSAAYVDGGNCVFCLVISQHEIFSKLRFESLGYKKMY